MAFRKATRAGTKALIGLHGGSGSGKTYSALMLARGLVGPDGAIFMIDTESRRGEMYVGQPGIGDYMVQQLEAPYSSQRYSDMIGEAVEAARGREAALVIDSFSHEWEGVGGVLDAAQAQADKRTARYNNPEPASPTFGDWKQPKQDHKHMVLAMLGAPLHIICCLRSQYKSRQIDRKDFEKFGIPANTKGNSVVTRDEFQTPIQDANFIYEMTVHAELRSERPGVPIIGKCPEMLRHAFPKGQPITNETGKLISTWCAGDEPEANTGQTKPDPATTGQGQPDAEALIVAAKSTASGGMDEYRTWFTGLADDSKRILTQTTEPDDGDFGQVKPVHDICKRIAAAADNGDG